MIPPTSLRPHDMTHIFTVDNRTALTSDHTADIIADMRIADFPFVRAACHRAGGSSGNAACVISRHDVLRQIQGLISMPFKSSVVVKSSSLIFPSFRSSEGYRGSCRRYRRPHSCRQSCLYHNRSARCRPPCFPPTMPPTFVLPVTIPSKLQFSKMP